MTKPIGAVRALAASYLLVGSAEWSVAVALATVVYDRTHSTGWISALVVARFLPSVLVGPVAGVLADRIDRRRVLVWSCALRVGPLLVLAALAVAGAAPALLVALAAVDAVLVTPFRPAALAVLPGLTGTGELHRATAVIGVCMQVTWVLGPALGALATLLVSPAFTFAATGVGLAGAAVAAARIRGDTAPGAVSVDVPRSMPQMWRDGVTALVAADGARALVALIVAVECVFGFELVAHVSVAADRLGLGAEGVGWLTAMVGLGGVLGTGAATRAARGRHAGLFAAGAGASFGVSLAVLGAVTSVPVALALMLTEGLGNVLYDVLGITLLQRLLAPGLLARGQAFVDAVGAVALTAGSLLAPLAIGGAGLTGAMLGAGLVMVVVVAALAPALAAVDRDTAGRVAQLAPVVECFRSTALFAMAPYPVVEQVAAAATLSTLPAATVVVEEGDTSDAVMVVESGRLAVSRAHVVVNELGPSDWFGEIGVVRGTPRSATVTTRTQARLWRIPADAFLATADATATVAAPLRSGVRTRLARTHPELLAE